MNQGEIHRILNWLFPYYLGKYAVNMEDRIQIEHIVFYALGWATLFSLVGIVGHLLGWTSLFGIDLFAPGNRYVFTISATNRAGFCLGVVLVLAMYFFVKHRFAFNKEMIIPLILFMITFAGLFLIKERKTILTVALLVFALFLVYRSYKLAIIMVVGAGLILLLVPIPERYHLREMAFNDGIMGRLNSWETALGLFKHKPLLGHGYPSFKKASKVYYNTNKDQYRFKQFYNWAIAHNLSLNALAETGILGFIVLNGIFFSTWRFYKYAYSDSVVFTLGVAICFIYVTMQVGNFVHSATRTDMAFMVMGLYQGWEQRYRRNINCQNYVPIKS